MPKILKHFDNKGISITKKKCKRCFAFEDKVVQETDFKTWVSFKGKVTSNIN